MSLIFRDCLLVPVLAGALFATMACGDRAASSVPPGSPGAGPQDDDPGYSYQTMADRTSIMVEEEVTVRCFVRRGDTTYRPDDPVRFDIQPEPSNVSFDGSTATFSTTQSGSYTAKCGSIDGSVMDPVGAEIRVRPHMPIRWDVVHDAQDCMGQLDLLRFTYVVYDRLDNRVHDAVVSATVTPNHGVQGTVDSGFRFSEDGEYQITVNVISSQDPESTITPMSVTVNVDATPPALDLASPRPGDMIQAGNHDYSPVNLSGTVSDESSPITSVRIDGIDLPVSGTNHVEQISATLDSRWGLTVAKARVQDACGNVNFVTIPFLRSPGYYPPNLVTNSASTVDRAMVGQLSQPFVDDGDRSDIDDLATMAEVAISNFDFNGFVAPGTFLGEKPVKRDCDGCPFGNTYASAGVKLWRHGSAGRRLNISGPWITNIDFKQGAVGFGVRIDDFAFPLKLKVEISQCAIGCETHDDINIDAWFGFDNLSVSGVIGANVWDGKANASVEQIRFDINGVYLNLDCGFMDFACDEVSDFIIERMEEKVEEMVEDAVRTSLPPTLADAMTGFSLQKSMVLPAPINSTLHFAVGLQDLYFCGPSVGLARPMGCDGSNSSPGSLGLSMYTQIFPGRRGSDIPYDARGAIKLPASSPTFPSASTSFGLGMRTDVVNQLFWSLWYGGVFDVYDVRDMMPSAPAGLRASLRMGLPPVIMPGENGNLFEIGIADATLEALIDVADVIEGANSYEVDISLTISAVIGAAIDIDNTKSTVRITPDPEPEIFFQINRINDVTYGGALGQLLSDMVADELPAVLAEAAAEFEIPSFDLSGLPGVPAGTIWRLRNANLVHDEGYLQFSGQLGP